MIVYVFDDEARDGLPLWFWKRKTLSSDEQRAMCRALLSSDMPI
jgi:hypothetical protein